MKRSYVRLQMAFVRPQEVNLQNITISYDQFVEWQPGIKTKILRPSDPISRMYSDAIDPKNATLMHVVLNKGALIRKHYHLQTERVIVLKGSFVEAISNKEYPVGAVLDIPPMEPHAIWMPQAGELLVGILPKINYV